MTTATKKETQDGFSEDGQIYYYSGKAFGLTEDLRTIRLGDVETIKKALKDKLIPKGLGPKQREVFIYVLNFREGVKDGEFQPKKRNPVRGRVTRDFKRREASIRQSAFRKAIPVRLLK